MDLLTPADRRALRAKAHHLQPVVTIGQHGLTPAVLHEIDLALLKHELIKVRVFSDERDQRETMLQQICTDMDCGAVQHLGKVLVLWRPNPELKKTESRPARPGPKSGAKRPKAPRTGPRTPLDPIRERRRGAQSESVPAGKGTRGAARFAAPADDFKAPVRRTRETTGSQGNFSDARKRGGDAPPPRLAAKGTRATTGATPRGATGTSRQKIRARGAAPAQGDAGDTRFDAPAVRRKSTYTPKTKPKSFSAKPNPREAWAKKPPAGSPKPASAATRRRRKV
jgi:RNA-binding protein